MDFLYSHQISNRIDPVENCIARESFFIDGSPVYQSKKKHQNEKLELEIPFPGHMVSRNRCDNIQHRVLHCNMKRSLCL